MTEPGYFLGTTSTKSVIRYWKPEEPKTINYCPTAKSYEYTTKLPSGEFSPGYQLTQCIASSHHVPDTTININDHSFLDSTPYVFQISLPPRGMALGLTLEE